MECHSLHEGVENLYTFASYTFQIERVFVDFFYTLHPLKRRKKVKKTKFWWTTLLFSILTPSLSFHLYLCTSQTNYNANLKEQYFDAFKLIFVSTWFAFTQAQWDVFIRYHSYFIRWKLMEFEKNVIETSQ